MRLVEERGSLVGAMVCDAEDQIFAIASNGVVIRTRVVEIRPSGRDTMGVTLMNLADGDTVVAVARAGEGDDSDSDGDEGEATV
jgi:DNA gyrase subunit A